MKYSIITINYNHAEGLRRTIESVVSQTCRDYEYIVIDGGSTDGSVDVIKEYADKIDFWVSEPDKGIYNAMNKGIDRAHGEYLNFMNSGDRFYSHTVLEEVAPLLTADIVSGIDNIEAQGKRRYPYRQESLSLMSFLNDPLPHQSTFIRREVNARTRYDESVRISADWKFFVHALVIQNCSYRDIDVVVCEFEPEGIGSQPENARAWRQEHWEILKQLLPERVIKDYHYYYGKESPMLDMIPRFNKTGRLHWLICAATSLILKIARK